VAASSNRLCARPRCHSVGRPSTVPLTATRVASSSAGRRLRARGHRRPAGRGWLKLGRPPALAGRADWRRRRPEGRTRKRHAVRHGVLGSDGASQRAGKTGWERARELVGKERKGRGRRAEAEPPRRSVGARALGSDARAKVNRAIDSAAAAATSGGTLSCCSLAHGRTRSDTKARRVRLEAEGFMAEEACTRTSQQPTARTGQGRRVRPTQRPGRRRSPGGRPTAAVAAAATAGASEEEERGRTGRWVRS
jgi:hypothetical protein